MDDEYTAELLGDSSHSLILLFAGSSDTAPSNRLLKEDGDSILQESGDYILLE